MPESLEVIGESAFAYSALKSIHIPKYVVSIGSEAFWQEGETGSLESLTFAPDSRLEKIGDAAFRYNVKLREVNFPDSVHTIGMLSFYGCDGLQKIILPAALKMLEYAAFAECPNYHTFIIQEGLEEIDRRPFSDNGKANTELKELVIPSTVKTLASYAIAYLHGLEKLTIAEGSQLETIGDYAFMECKKLQELTLPATVREIGTANTNYTYDGVNIPVSAGFTFRNCNSLRKLDMSACTELTVIPTAFLEDCTALETLLLPPSLERIEDFAFGDPLRVINDSASYNDNLISLKEITIPATVNYIGAYAFNGCVSLETVTFAEGSELTELGVQEPIPGKGYSGMNIFTGTTSLKTVKLPENLELIGLSCFENSGVETIELPDTVKVIADCAFKNCDNLVEVNLPKAMTELGNEAYCDCDKLQKAELKDGLQELGSLAFAYCEQLTSAHIPGTVTMIHGNPWGGCTSLTGITKDEGCKDYVLLDGILYDKTMYTLVYYPASATAETFQLPDTVQELAPGAFAGAQLKQFTLPTRITKVSAHAFGQSQIESITFHNGVNSVGDYAFYGCAKLNNVTLLSNIKYAGDYAFANCTSLNNFVFEDVPDGADPYTIGEHFFDGCTAMTQIVLPNRYTNSAAIPAYMFANSGLVNVVIPASITDISTEGVFYGCKSMETLTFEAKKLTKNYIGLKYFYGCSKLKELTIPSSGISYIASDGSAKQRYAFAECTSLEKLTITTSASYLTAGCGAFLNCKNLKELNIQKANGTKVGFRYIYDNSFDGCSSLKNITFNASSAYIYGNAFENTGFESMHIKVSTTLRMYNGNNFAGMPNLKELWLVAKASTFTADTFENLASDVNIYFYEQTYEEVVALCGEAWFKNASKKAHFFFKGEIPEGVVPPEGVVLPTE